MVIFTSVPAQVYWQVVHGRPFASSKPREIGIMAAARLKSQIQSAFKMHGLTLRR